MKLLPFQAACIERLSQFLKQVHRWQTEAPSLPNIPQTAWDCLDHPPQSRPYCSIRNSAGESVPCATIVIPTGGGKTITALAAGIEAIRTLSDEWSCLVWTVPSEAIFTQTRKYLNEGFLRDFALDAGYIGINLKVIGDPWTDLDFDSSYLTVLLVSQQSVFGDRSDLHFRRTSDALRHLSVWKSNELEPTLYNLLLLVRPIFVIDECHRTYTETGRTFFRETAIARAIIEFSATPKDFSSSEYPNVIQAVSAAQLVEEQLIKNPLICHFSPNSTAEAVIRDAVRDRRGLEKRLQSEGFDAKPKFLVSCRRTSEQHADDPLSVHSIRALLLSHGVDGTRIAIKSSEQDDLGSQDVDSPLCQFEFILTQRALVEGWDAKTVFGIVLLNDIGANLTNFQIVGRGLRQPGKSYFSKSDLNAVHVYSNSDKQDPAIKALNGFLEGEGLSSGLSIRIKGTEGNYAPSLVDQRRITVPVVELNKSNSYLAAEASSRLSEDPPSFLASEEVIAILGIAEQTNAIVDLASDSRPTPMVSRRSSRASLSEELWSRRFISSAFCSLHPYFRSTKDCLSWVVGQLDHFVDSDKFSIIQRFEPARVSLAITPTIRDAHTQHRHTALLKSIPDATLDEIEICGDLVGPIYAPSDQLGTIPFSNSIIGDVPKSAFNEPELDFARHLDSLGVNWVRNQPGRGWYSVVGGTNNRFYPDFLVLEGDNGSRHYTKIIAIETKGAHLMDNNDSQLKAEICQAISDQFGSSVCLIFNDFTSSRVKLAQHIRPKRSNPENPTIC